MNGHWYVVASQLRLKIFTQERDTKKLKLVKTLENPLGRERSRNLHGKKPGIGIRSSSSGGGFRHSETKGLSPHEQAAVQFSRKVAKYFERAYENKDFTSLTIASEPHFMGKLKTSMKSDLNKMVVTWIKKDFQKLPDRDLPKVLNLKGEDKILFE